MIVSDTKKMTVAELIERLRAFPPYARVIVHGYETGFDDVIDVCERPISANSGATLRVARQSFGARFPYIPRECGGGMHSEPDAEFPATETAVWIIGDRG